MHLTNYIVQPGTGQRVLNLGALVTIKIPSNQTGGAFAVVEHTVPPGGGPPLHVHSETELLYVLDGEFEFVLGSARTRVGKGGVVHVPPRTLHASKNVGASAGRQLSIYLPGGAEGFFLEAGVPTDRLEKLPDLDQPADLSGIDMQRVLELAAKYGMEVVRPA